MNRDDLTGDADSVLRLTHVPPNNAKDTTSLEGPIDNAEKNARLGRNLENSDIVIFSTKQDRDEFQSDLVSFYRLSLSLDSSEGPISFSHTSRKMILLDAHGTSYVLKQKPFYCKSPEHCLAFVHVQQAAAERTQIVPRIVQGADGEHFFSWKGELYFLTPRIRGRVFNGSFSDSEECASAIAHLHDSLHDLNLDYASNLPRYTLTDSSREARKFVNLMLTQPLAQKEPDRYRSTADQIMDIVDDVERSLRAVLVRQPVLMHQWIHGDPGPFNFVMFDGSVAAINDFDNVGIGSVNRDLAILFITQTAVYYKGATSSLRLPILKRLDSDRLLAMWQAYVRRAVRSTPNAEVLPYEMALHWLELMGLGLVRGDYSIDDVTDALPFARKIVTDAAGILEPAR